MTTLGALTQLAQLAVFAVLITKVTDYLKGIGLTGNLPLGAVQVPISGIISIVLGLVVAFGANLDLLAELGLTPTVPALFVFLTGIILGGGSQLLYDIVDAMQTPPAKVT